MFVARIRPPAHRVSAMAAMTLVSDGDREDRRHEDVSVVIVDSEQALAQALAQALVNEPGIGVANAAADPEAAGEVLDALPVDVAVVATERCAWDPFAFTREIGSRWPDVAIVAMSADDNAAHAAAAVRAGATSWVSKQITVRELGSVVVGAGNGEAYVP